MAIDFEYNFPEVNLLIFLIIINRCEKKVELLVKYQLVKGLVKMVWIILKHLQIEPSYFKGS